MSIVRKSDVTFPKLPQQVEPFEPLGGHVVVRGLKLTERLALRQRLQESAALAFAPALLAMAVVDAEGEALATPEEWDALGATHPAAFAALFDVAHRLSGFDVEAERKN